MSALVAPVGANRTATGWPARPGGVVIPMPLRRSPAPADAQRLRLTRRGRVVIALLIGVLLLGGLVAGVALGGTASAGSSPRTVPVSYQVVLPGDTLWRIAGEVSPRADRRDTVARLMELNALTSGRLFAGQRLAVPAHLP